MRDPVRAAQQNGAERNEVGNARQHAVRRARQGFGRQIDVVAPRREWHARKQQDRRPAHLFLAEDHVHVVVRVLEDAAVRLAQQLFAVTEERGLRRADLRAGGLLAGEHALAAHRALADARIERIPLVLGNVERTRNHAVAAAHALRGVVYYRAFGRLLQGGHGTDGRATGVFAVHAQPPHELFTLRADVGELVRRLEFFGGNFVVVGKFVLLGASLLAGFA